jgi:hypothetical protein
MSDQFDTARKQLRATHGVRLVQSHEEGTAAAKLPEGVYGFTGSPGLAAPLFAQRRYRNFEVHHCNGDVFIVGFVSPADEARLTGRDASSAGDPVEVTVYPDPEGDATRIVAIGYSSIVQHRQYSIRNAAGVRLRVRPLGQFVPPGSAPTRQQAGPVVAQ